MEHSKELLFFKIRLSKAIKDKIRQQGLTQVQAAKKTGVSQSNISRILSMEFDNIETMINVASRLEIPMDLKVG